MTEAESTFTPGPWHLDYIYGEPCVTPHRDGVKNSPWCKQFHPSYEADAHLVAAAPELHEVAQRYLAGRASEEYEDWPGWDAIDTLARAALAKAKGESTE